ncbi:hypothetical protein ACIBHY_29930 [Nonomuraea sp. NPDC050547]|uniref:hypothetical protein n=1 Tax=Nonomuraea sp. NPDC050547 TaxID=3364368 RepID=UPI0037AE3843
MTGIGGRRTPLTALAGRAWKPVPTIDQITVTVTVSDGNTITLDILKPLNAELDYRPKHGNCALNHFIGMPTHFASSCQDEHELVLAVDLNPWRDEGKPAFTVTTTHGTTSD